MFEEKRLLYFISKRTMDLGLSVLGLFLFLPFLVLIAFFIWMQDFHSPLYISKRVGKNQKEFRMIKLRSMIVDAELTGVDSTSDNDSRITSVGRLVRKYKLDELGQLWNIMKGEMSLVGPRPNVKNEVDLYTNIELQLLNVKPGLTDISSIVFSDEGKILENTSNADLAYNQLIRPRKSYLGIYYVKNMTVRLDFVIIVATIMNIFSRKAALSLLSRELIRQNAEEKLLRFVNRLEKLKPIAPPGANSIVVSRLPKKSK